MESSEARGKAEAMRWLRNRLRTEALLDGLHSRERGAVIQLRGRRKPAAQDVDAAQMRLSS